MAYEILSENLQSLDDTSFNYDYQAYYHYKTSTTRNYKRYFDYSIDTIDEKFINRITVKSSNVKWIDYIRDLAVLVVRFKNSSVYYLYFDVPEDVYLEFQKVDSPGKFVHDFLRGRRYESHEKYADWLNIYRSLNEITNGIEGESQ